MLYNWIMLLLIEMHAEIDNIVNMLLSTHLRPELTVVLRFLGFVE